MFANYTRKFKGDLEFRKIWILRGNRMNFDNGAPGDTQIWKPRIPTRLSCLYTYSIRQTAIGWLNQTSRGLPRGWYREGLYPCLRLLRSRCVSHFLPIFEVAVWGVWGARIRAPDRAFDIEGPPRNASPIADPWLYDLEILAWIWHDLSTYGQILKDSTTSVYSWHDFTRFGDIWQDSTRFGYVCQDLEGFDLIWEYMARFEMNVEVFTRFINIWKPWGTLARFTATLPYFAILRKIRQDMERFRNIRQDTPGFGEVLVRLARCCCIRTAWLGRARFACVVETLKIRPDLARFGMDRVDPARRAEKILQDSAKFIESWLYFTRFGKIWQYPTRLQPIGESLTR